MVISLSVHIADAITAPLQFAYLVGMIRVFDACSIASFNPLCSHSSEHDKIIALVHVFNIHDACVKAAQPSGKQASALLRH